MTTCICFTCGTRFERYSISAKRAAKPQFCSRECQAAEESARAAERLPKRFWSNVEIMDDQSCWPWTGRRDPKGYGRFDRHGRPELAHRVAFILKNGPLGDSESVVCHRCDNPPCCNPRHLFTGSQADNVADMDSKGRRVMPPTRRGESSNKAKLTAEQARAVFEAAGSYREIGERHGISGTAVRLIKIGRNWAHATGAA